MARGCFSTFLTLIPARSRSASLLGSHPAVFFMPSIRHLRVDVIVQRLEHIGEVLSMEPDIFRWIAEQVAPEAYAPHLAVDHRPCLHPPGSAEKIAALRKRWAKDLGLWNPEDKGHD